MARELHRFFVHGEAALMKREWDQAAPVHREEVVRHFMERSRSRWVEHIVRMRLPVAKSFYKRYKKDADLPYTLVEEIRRGAERRSGYIVATRRDRLLQTTLPRKVDEDAWTRLEERWRAEAEDASFSMSEVANESNHAALRGAYDSYEYKQWWAVNDEVTRPSHAQVSGAVVPIDALFEVGDYEMEAPGDDSAGPEETMNCRCWLEFGLMEEFGR